MIRTEQNDALDFALALPEQTVGRCSDIAGINVPGMRRDHGFGLKARDGCACETAVYTCREFIRMSRVKEAGYARQLHVCAHIQSSRNCAQSPSSCRFRLKRKG